MNRPETLTDVVRRRLVRLALGERPGVVAVSGGPDSVALLRVLLELRAEGRAGPLTVAHLNHQLRGVLSDADEKFVCELCARLAATGDTALRCLTTRIDIAAVARRRTGLPAAARQVRYRWLSEVARTAGADWVATGHTADDQAETVLHRLLRGAGLRGLAGIPVRRPLADGIEVIRPLLEVRRAQVLTYLEALGQSWRQDPSNADTHQTRNRIRHELVPFLAERFSPAVVAILCRLATQARQACRAAEARAMVLLRKVELPRAGDLVVLDARQLDRASRPLLREVLRLLWRREGWPLGAMGFAEWQRAAAAAHGELATLDLPGGVRLCRRRRVVQIGKGR